MAYVYKFSSYALPNTAHVCTCLPAPLHLGIIFILQIAPACLDNLIMGRCCWAGRPMQHTCTPVPEAEHQQAVC